MSPSAPPSQRPPRASRRAMAATDGYWRTQEVFRQLRAREHENERRSRLVATAEEQVAPLDVAPAKHPGTVRQRRPSWMGPEPPTPVAPSSTSPRSRSPRSRRWLPPAQKPPSSRRAPVTSRSKPWFEVLGVSADVSLEALRARFRELARLHHPDRGGDAVCFHRITIAYRNGLRVAFGVRDV